MIRWFEFPPKLPISCSAATKSEQFKQRSTSVDNNGPSNRVSISDLDLVLVSSGSQGSSGGGSGGRRSASNDQVIIR